MPVPAKIIFFGTPEFAAEILENLVQSSVFTVAAVVTTPDAPSGRGQKLTPTPVKVAAEQLRLKVLTPERLNDAAYQELEKIGAELFLVVAYGKMFPERFLTLAKFGAFNLHPSLLPKYRGASPIQSAILAGEQISGFTIFQLTKAMDAGDIYLREEFNISGKTASEIFQEVAVRGSKTLRTFTEEILSGKQFTPEKQIEAEASYSRKFSKADGQIFPERETRKEILRKYRAFDIWPQIFYIDPASGKRVKLLKIQEYREAKVPSENGVFQKFEGKCLMKTRDGFVEILVAQPEGKKEMSGVEFWNYWNSSSFNKQ